MDGAGGAVVVPLGVKLAVRIGLNIAGAWERSGSLSSPSNRHLYSASSRGRATQLEDASTPRVLPALKSDGAFLTKGCC